MNCDEMRARLDAYIDGELTMDEMRAVEAHAAGCEACGRELTAAKFVRDALGELGDEVAVPLPAHVGWQRAVRAEAKRGSNRRRMRAVYAAAAALVLVIGAFTILRSMPARQDDSAMMLAAMPTEAVVARDGDMQAAAVVVEEEAYAAWKKYDAEDFDAACLSVEQLIEEYSGSFQPVGLDEGPMVYRIELPREYLEDFLSAVSHVGAEQDSETMDTQGDTALVYIQINR